MKVELRIFLPDDNITTVAVLRSHKTDEVFKVKYHEHKKGCLIDNAMIVQVINVA